MCAAGLDWRLERLETQPYLRGVAFVRKPYRAPSATWDHDHCVGCWAKFAEPGHPAAEAHEGYATTADFVRGAEYDWVCVPCFEAFREAMNWIDATPPDPASSR